MHRNRVMDAIWHDVLAFASHGAPLTEAQMQRNHADLHVLWGHARSVLERHDLVYWASSGTLLGAVREGDIIRHDDDIDLCMPKNSYERLLSLPTDAFPDGIQLKHVKAGQIVAEKLNEELCQGLKTCRSMLDLIPALRDFTFTQLRMKDLWIDVYDVERDGRVWKPNSGIAWRFPDEYFDDEDVFPLNRTRMGADSVMIPLHPHRYLRRNYGADWHVPKFTHNHAGISVENVLDAVHNTTLAFHLPTVLLSALLNADSFRSSSLFKWEL